MFIGTALEGMLQVAYSFQALLVIDADAMLRLSESEISVAKPYIRMGIVDLHYGCVSTCYGLLPHFYSIVKIPIPEIHFAQGFIIFVIHGIKRDGLLCDSQCLLLPTL